MTQISRYPLIRHTMASEMPVLPLVGSMTVQPGRKRPSASAAATIASAGRSLMEPVGFRSSSLAHNRTEGDGDSRGRPTSGVPPTASIRLPYRAMRSVAADCELGATGDGRQDGDLVALGDGCLQPTGEANVLVIDVNVHETVQGAVLDQ